jgi:uncharacterized protein
MEPTILTLHGRSFDYRAPERHQFDIEEIAHALSNLCRFTGHTRSFYSVAQHSVLVCDLAPSEHKLEALLHDAHEAYVGDVNSPLKALLPMYREVEARAEAALRAAFGLPAKKATIVKYHDLSAYQIERFVLMPRGDEAPGEDPPHPYPLHPLQPRDARELFLARWHEVRHG